MKNYLLSLYEYIKESVLIPTVIGLKWITIVVGIVGMITAMGLYYPITLTILVILVLSWALGCIIVNQ